MFKRALVSTSDKTGLVEFLQPLVASGCEVVSTGGTSQFLRKNGLKVTEVSEVTGFPEVMDGRVRTLHPHIHMGLLARSEVSEDWELLEKHGVKSFDLVVVNLYPFEESFKRGLRGAELIEQIDIGGPSLLRASAKSHERVTVVCDPQDYSQVLKHANEGSLDKSFRQRLAVKVFEHCAFYDSIVAQALNTQSWDESPTMTIPLRRKQKLRYGENPHQKAVWYESPFPQSLSLSQAKQWQGKELSYNNILDLEAAVAVVADFEGPVCAIIKHLTPCGVACDKNGVEAYRRAFEADPVSAFGGIVALNSPLTEELAEQLVGPFLECVMAPHVESKALERLASKKNLRVLTLETLHPQNRKTANGVGPNLNLEIKSLRGGGLVQTADGPFEWNPAWKIIGAVPDEKIKADLVFAQKVVRHVKSNAIVVAKNGQTLGICGGQTNRVDSVKWALERAQGRAQGKIDNLILGSDAFFPFRDSIELAAKSNVTWIIQPGGSLRDSEVEAAAKERGINMVITGVRHFKH